MLPLLLGRPKLDVQIVAPGSPIVTGTALMEVNGRFQLVSQLAIRRLVPKAVKAGEALNTQAGGDSPLWVDCSGATASTVVWFDDRPLATSFGSPSASSALVPKELIRAPGVHLITLKDASSRLSSERSNFVIEN